MAKDIEQAKQELLALYESEKADAMAHRLKEREALLSEAIAMTQTLFTKSEFLTFIVEQAETLVMPIQQLDTFGDWLQSSFSTTDLHNYGVFLNQLPNEALHPGEPYLCINTGTTNLQGSIDQPVIATFVGAWTVEVRQATIHASQDAHIHVKDDVAKVKWHGTLVNDVSAYSDDPIRNTGSVEASPLTDQERQLRDALVDRLRQSGIEVIDNVEVGQRLLDEANNPARLLVNNRVIEPASVISNEIHQSPVVRENLSNFGEAVIEDDLSGLAEQEEMHKDTIRQQIVYHGSGADFDVFDFSHMSEGEGAQSYGWGGYVTEVEGIGRTYAKMNNNTLRRSRLESDISRLSQSLPFRRGDAKREGEEELKQLKDELSRLDVSWKSVLYTVEIPDDNGKNYLAWEKPLSEAVLKRINKNLEAKGMKKIDRIYPSRVDGKITNQDFYDSLSAYPSTKQKASAILNEIGFVGISYPSNFRSGGTKDNSRNYVLFNQNDMKIIDKVRFFRTPSGESYGFTANGKIYIDPRIATAETPIHEYAHLWASVMRQENKPEWDHIVTLMKGTPVWDHVRRIYPTLKTDDEIADEVLAHYSGRRGAERLRTELSKSGHATAAIQGIKEVLARFWRGIANMFKIRFTTAEDVADRVLFDLLRGVNPYSRIQHIEHDKEEANLLTRANDGIRYQFEGERGAINADNPWRARLRTWLVKHR